jgi:hypothetical protein
VAKAKTPGHIPLSRIVLKGITELPRFKWVSKFRVESGVVGKVTVESAKLLLIARK